MASSKVVSLVLGVRAYDLQNGKIKQGLLLSYVVRVSVILIECEYRWENASTSFLRVDWNTAIENHWFYKGRSGYFVKGCLQKRMFTL